MTERNGKHGKLSVLFLAAEMAPFAKEGGLADVAGALPKALAAEGVEVTVVLPLYGHIDRAAHGITPDKEEPAVDIPMGDAVERAVFYRCAEAGASFPVYFVENSTYFGRKGIYNDPSTGEGFADNAERFIFFQKAVMRTISRRADRLNIAHCNDYHTALIPYYLRREPALRHVASLYSIHNMAYQGIEPPSVLPIAGIPREEFQPMSPFEYFGRVNMMKIGIRFADLLSTVSPTYAREIQSSEEYGYGLEGDLRARSADLVGILNGVDPDVWNPRTDPLIPYNYSSESLDDKRRNKRELLKLSGLPVPRSRKPLLGMISRLADQKGFDILGEALDEILAMDLQMVVLGSGQRKYHEMLQAAARRYPRKLAAHLKFDNRLAHLIEAGADMFLMPSRYEPCGLNQLYSMAYGTAPIVRATGGLADTVQAFDPATGQGAGFRFDEYSAGALLDAVRKAVNCFSDERNWIRIVRNGMAYDCTWRTSALQYIETYKRAMEKRQTTGE